MHSPGNSARSAAERQLTVSDKLARQVAMTAQQLTHAAHSTEGSAAFANHGSCVNGWWHSKQQSWWQDKNSYHAGLLQRPVPCKSYLKGLSDRHISVLCPPC